MAPAGRGWREPPARRTSPGHGRCQTCGERASSPATGRAVRSGPGQQDDAAAGSVVPGSRTRLPPSARPAALRDGAMPPHRGRALLRSPPGTAPGRRRSRRASGGRPGGRAAKKGEATASGCIAEHTSWTKPGRVSSSDRVPPPARSAASSTTTEQLARASVTAAARPLGPAPTTTASSTPRSLPRIPRGPSEVVAVRRRRGARCSRCGRPLGVGLRRAGLPQLPQPGNEDRDRLRQRRQEVLEAATGPGRRVLLRDLQPDLLPNVKENKKDRPWCGGGRWERRT